MDYRPSKQNSQWRWFNFIITLFKFFL